MRRAVFSFLKGIVVGLVLVFAVLQLPGRLQIWGIVGVVVVAFIFVIWQHLSLRRDIKAFEERMTAIGFGKKP